MKPLPPAMIAAGIAGGTIGGAYGFMTKGEKLEEQGASEWNQFTGAFASGVMKGVGGTGIGMGVSGTAIALKHILKK